MQATQPPSLFEQQVDGAIRSSIFRCVPPTLLDGLLTDAIRVELPSGRFLPDAGLSLVVAGLVRVFVAGPDGRQVTFAYLKAGDVMGWRGQPAADIRSRSRPLSSAGCCAST